MRTASRIVVAALLFACAPWAAAQSLANAQLSGSVSGVSAPPAGYPTYGGSFSLTFKCTGTPTCTGSYQSVEIDNHCSTPVTVADTVRWSGLDLSKPGPIAGQIELNGVIVPVRAANGACIAGPTYTSQIPFTGTWDGTTGSIVFDGMDSEVPPATIHIAGTFKVDAVPAPFPMVVSALIDSSSANASAQIQFRPQDVGKQGSVYVFAMAPSAIVKAAPDGTKADPTLPCVIAQLSAAGQLVAVSAQSLQAYISGVLGSGGQAVTILNGVPTVNIAGATFLVGYGPNSSTMYSSGSNRAVVTVPGTVTCKSERPQDGWWWNPAESGRGFSIESHDNAIFLATYLYDAGGQATWLAAAGTTTLEGTAFQGDLQAYANGQVLGGAYRAAQTQLSPGTIALTFQDASHGVLSWPGGNIPIERFDMVANGRSLPAVAGQPQSGWWWSDKEPGRGYFIEWQGANAFLATYMYSAAGSATWYAAQATTPDVTRFSASLRSFINGQTLTGAYRPPNGGSTLGTVAITFTGPDTATLSLPNSAPIAIKRFRF